MPSASRDILEAAHDAVSALTGWTPSRWTISQFGRDPSRAVHMSYALGLPETAPDPNDRRQVVAQGIIAVSTLELRWAHAIRGDAAASDYAMALEEEQALVLAVLGLNRSPGISILLRGIPQRDDSREGWMLGLVRFDVIHRYGLTT